MSKQGKRELLEALRPRYVKANKAEKSRMLDEFVAATGYHRKYASHLLHNGPPPRSRKKVGSRRKYGQEVVVALAKVWEASGNLCGKRLQPFLEELVEVVERHGELTISLQTKRLLVQMSAASIDRHLKAARTRLPQRGRTTTKPGSLLKDAIPIRTFADWNENQPGFVEVDLVAHCGETTAGEYLHTLCMIDIATRWTELRGLPNRGQTATFAAIKDLRADGLPFPLLGIDSDNGGEFINDQLYRYCLQEHITFTRSRPYKKNDQAHVEQKNWTAIRQWIGYQRYESPQALALLELIYADLCLLINFFQPTMKLLETHRVGSKVRKKYDSAQTPYQRVRASSEVNQATKDLLSQLYLSLNPLALQARIDNHLHQLWSLER